MRSLEEFTKRQKDKFLFAQIIINILDIYGFKYKIGGSFVKFITGDADNFHDIDIIVPATELNNVLFYIKTIINDKLLSDINVEYNYFRIKMYVAFFILKE